MPLFLEHKRNLSMLPLDAKTKTGYKFKIGHYRKALKKIKSVTVELSNIEDAEALDLFTPGEIKHIKSFLESDALETPQVEDPKTQEIHLLQTVTGIGPKKADTLYGKGLTLKNFSLVKEKTN